MRLANSRRTLLPLALSAVLATCALAQEHPNVQPSAVRDLVTNQAAGQSPAPAAPQTPAQPAAKPAGPATAKAPAKAAAKAPAKAAAKAPAKTPAKPPAEAKEATKTAAAANPAKPPVEKPAVEKPLAKRDPFDALLTKARAASAPPENLPPGKAGLIVETLRIDGIVRSASGMIAIVSNSQQRVYFLREGDKLYDGSVEKIALDAITFHEIGKDAFGKPLEHTVTKRLYPSPGEQQ
jgi:Tfp pilus assembly protein PilP